MSERPTFLERFSLSGISIKRLFGFAFFQLWITLMFNSIEPYLVTADVRGSLYLSQLISLIAMAITLLLITIVIPKNIRIGSNRAIVGSFTALMCVGTFCAVFSDINTVTGMMYLSIGAILTGVGSAGLLLSWLENLFFNSGKLAFVELALSFLIAFALGLACIFLPSIVVVTIVLCLPLGSVALLFRTGLREKSGLVNGAGAQANSLPIGKRSLWLFGKALVGCFLFGMVEGFFDRLSGYRAYMVQDIYGVFLLLGSLAAIAVVCVIAIAFRRESVFYAYRFAMMLFCVGCLLTPFLSDNVTYHASALIFGGYNCFLVLLGGICIDVARGFRTNPVKTIGLGVFALFTGETVGMVLERLLYSSGLQLELTSITLVTVSALFISFLFLFNETDLIRIGIGDLDTIPDGARALDPATAHDRNAEGGELAGGTAAESSNTLLEDTYSIIAERFALSQRESDVLPLLLQGRTISRIQSSLYISAGTVSTHIRHIYQKTGANNRQELIDLLQDMIDSEKESR